MMDWYLAPSLVVLRDEINARWPGRDKTSDGTIGDDAHQATRSDHNPNVRGSVNAIDVDEDGIGVYGIFAAIKRHPSARYFIYERRLYHRLRGWVAEPYTGVNPHDKHFHLSIDQTEEAEQDRRPWGLLEDDMPGFGFDSGEQADAVHWRTGKLREEHQAQSAMLAEVLANVRELRGQDWVDEQAIVKGVLDGLGHRPVQEAADALRAVYEGRPDELAQLVALLGGTGTGSSE
jgi:hypothetical protein